MLWAWSYMTEMEDIRIEELLERPDESSPSPLKLNMRKVLQFLSTEKAVLVIPAIRIVGNVCVGSDATIDNLISIELLQAIAKLLCGDFSVWIIKEILNIAHNMSTGPSRHPTNLMSAGVIDALCKFIVSSPSGSNNLDLKICAADVLTTALSALPEEDLERMMDKGPVFGVLIQALGFKDPTVQCKVVNTIDYMLSLGSIMKFNTYAISFHSLGGYEELGKLATHPNKVLSSKADTVVNRYFSEDASTREIEQEDAVRSETKAAGNV